ncbi:DUF2142 domain-containing protein [Paenibacillus durus]|uniref:DUF2142 domain-containing protein n=1 Tax=Paenibacillus durus ATCC 35681 TaxID=1333534 RepID=A0A0F7CJU3_PAEDU|nr:DUF2142 domain-containing protein [Paenibacillus durus]AKG36511.1 hypothetical protein VK70_19870 [Paenibacillus durus ATCC 35681]
MFGRYKIENIFLSIGLIFGLLLVFLVPPLQSPDEDSHFKKAYLVSNMHFFPEVGPNGEIGNYISKSIVDFEDSLRYLIGNMDAKYSYKSQYFSSHLEVDKGQSVFIQYSTSQANPILFIPQSLGMFILKVTVDNPLFGFNQSISPINYLYIGRVFNLIFYLVMCYFSLKIIPILKNALLLITLMPMTFSLASSLSYDCVIISTIFLFVAFVLRICIDTKITVIDRRLFLFFLIFSIVIIQFKQVYYPLFLLTLFIPVTKFRNKKAKIIFISSMIAAGVISLLLWSGLTNTLLHKAKAVSDNHSLDQIKFILHSPFQYAEILFNTFKSSLKFYFVGFVGDLGWLDTNYPYLFLILYFAAIIISAFFDNTEFSVRIKLKVFSFTLSFIVIILIETALYAIWTSLDGMGGVGAALVTGVQGRYFIPISITMLIIFKNNFSSQNKFINSLSNKISFLVPHFIVFSMILTILIILIRYWIPVV